MTRLRWMAVLLLLGFGAIRQHWEDRIAESLTRQHFLEEDALPQGSLREQLGQLGAAAALGGFRSFLATLSELRGITAYTDVDYSAVESHYHLATQLQPREPGYWNTAAWMMDANARRYYLTFALERTEEERAVLAGLSVERGKRFLDDGVEYNPEDFDLQQALGNHLALRREDFCGAAEAFARAATLLEGPTAAERHHAIYLAQCPGREEEAYGKLRRISEAIQRGESPIPRGMMPISLVLHMRYLERILGMPEEMRYPTQFDFSALYRRLRTRLPRGPRGLELREVPGVHRIRLQRLEEILEIPRVQRIPFQEKLRPVGGRAN